MKLKNVAPLNICHKNRNILTRGLQHFVCGERGCKVGNNSSCTRLHKCFWTMSRLKKWELGCSSPNMAAIYHFWFELSLAKIEPGRRSQVISLGGKGTDHFSSIINNSMNSTLSLEWNLVKGLYWKYRHSSGLEYI